MCPGILLISPVEKDFCQIGHCHEFVYTSNLRLGFRENFQRRPDFICNLVQQFLTGINIVRGSLDGCVIHCFVIPWNLIEHSLKFKEIMCPEHLHFCNPALTQRHLLFCALVQHPESGVATLYAYAQMVPFAVCHTVSRIKGEGFKTMCFPSVSSSATAFVCVIGTDRSCAPVSHRKPADAPVLWIWPHKCRIGSCAELIGTFRCHQQFLADGCLWRIVQKNGFLAGGYSKSGNGRHYHMLCFHFCFSVL